MTAEVKAVTDVVRTITLVKSRASALSDRLRAQIAESNAALDMVTSLADSLDEATAELRGDLATMTNSPPKDVVP